MLEKMSNIDWEQLQAPKIPSWLYQMTSEDEKIRSEAHVHFGEQVLHTLAISDEIKLNNAELFRNNIQLTALPFLIELLEDDNVHDKNKILYAFHTMITYIHFIDSNDTYYSKAMELRNAVWEYHDIYIDCLESRIRKTQIATIQLLAEFGEHGSYILSHFHRLIEGTHKKDLLSIVLWEINHNLLKDGKVIIRLPPEFVSYLEMLIESNPEHIIRITSAIILINTLDKNAPEIAIIYLTKALINRSDKPPLEYNIRTVLASVQAKILVKLGVEKGLSIAIQIIDESPIAENRFHALLAALILVFSTEQNSYNYTIIPSYKGSELEQYTLSLLHKDNVQSFNPTTLNTEQEKVLEVIVQNDWIWEIKSNVLEIFNLPKSRAELTKLI